MTLYESLVHVSNLLDLHRDLKRIRKKVESSGLGLSTEDTLATLVDEIKFELDKLEIPHD
mgnify:CR=1 FL=1